MTPCGTGKGRVHCESCKLCALWCECVCVRAHSSLYACLGVCWTPEFTLCCIGVGWGRGFHKLGFRAILLCLSIMEQVKQALQLHSHLTTVFAWVLDTSGGAAVGAADSSAPQPPPLPLPPPHSVWSGLPIAAVPSAPDGSADAAEAAAGGDVATAALLTTLDRSVSQVSTTLQQQGAVLDAIRGAVKAHGLVVESQPYCVDVPLLRRSLCCLQDLSVGHSPQRVRRSGIARGVGSDDCAAELRQMLQPLVDVGAFEVFHA